MEMGKTMLHRYRQIQSSCKIWRCWFDSSNYEVERPLSLTKNEKVVGLMRMKIEIQSLKDLSDK